MNYIKQLQTQVADQEARISSALEAIDNFRAHLQLPKFTAPASTGERTDWIATSDVMARLQDIKNTIT